MKQLAKKYSIKIPKDVTVLYSNKKKIITFLGDFKKKSLKIKTKIFFIKSKNIVSVTNIPLGKISNKDKKQIKSVRKLTASLIKQMIIETSNIFYTKLRLVGVGYRVFDLENFENRLILLKLGKSHPIYFRIPKNIKISTLKLTKLFVFGHSYQFVNQISSLIRSYKKPEPYKGKGILYENEKILLKEGKKI